MRRISRKAEDYLEAILNVTLEKGYARTKDVAEELGISPPSVVEMFRKLDAMGLINYRRYEGVTLKPEGKEIAEVIRYRHDTLRTFLTLINVPEKIADHDACIMEHELDTKTIEQLRMFVDFLNTHFYKPDTLQLFESFCKVRRTEEQKKRHRPADREVFSNQGDCLPRHLLPGWTAVTGAFHHLFRDVF